MALIKSAKKAIRSSERKRVMNLRRKRTLHDAQKSVRTAMGADRTVQNDVLAKAYQAIDKALKRGVIKKNTAARKKSRLAKSLKPASAQ